MRQVRGQWGRPPNSEGPAARPQPEAGGRAPRCPGTVAPARPQSPRMSELEKTKQHEGKNDVFKKSKDFSAF